MVFGKKGLLDADRVVSTLTRPMIMLETYAHLRNRNTNYRGGAWLDLSARPNRWPCIGIVDDSGTFLATYIGDFPCHRLSRSIHSNLEFPLHVSVLGSSNTARLFRFLEPTTTTLRPPNLRHFSSCSLSVLRPFHAIIGFHKMLYLLPTHMIYAWYVMF